MGKLVGVSYQAVGKWEKGGAPDVMLLPILSRQLGVTIDALFGMEGGTQENPTGAVDRWLRGFPSKERLNQFCRLVWAVKASFVPDEEGEISLPMTDYPETCKLAFGNGGEFLQLSQIAAAGGFLFDVHAEDLSFVTLWPRPKDGWAKWLAPKEEYRRLFALLAKPGCLELMEYIYNRKTGWFSPNAVTKHLNMAQETVEELLEALAELRLLSSMALELEDGEANIYKVVEPWKLIPFLLLARTLMQWDSNYLKLYDPLLPLFEPAEVWEETKPTIPE